MLAMVLHCVCSSDQHKGTPDVKVSWPRWFHSNTNRKQQSARQRPCMSSLRHAAQVEPGAPPRGCRSSTLAMPSGIGPACSMLHAQLVRDTAQCASLVPLANMLR
jgi:hypothetical protein